MKAQCNEMMALGVKKRGRQTAHEVIQDTESRAAELRQPRQMSVDVGLVDASKDVVTHELDGSENESTKPRAPNMRNMAVDSSHGVGGWGTRDN